MAPPGPPKDIPPDRLFRILLAAPRATLPVVLPIAGAERGAFFVRALRPLEEAAAYDGAPADAPEAVRASLVGAALTVLALRDGDGSAVFRSARGLLELMTSREADALIATVLGALDVVSPSYRRSNLPAWMATLAAGARHRDNYTIASSLAKCVDGEEHFYDARGRRTAHRPIERPDRFFGTPLGRLTDGHWMAFRAARRVLLEDRRNG